MGRKRKLGQAARAKWLRKTFSGWYRCHFSWTPKKYFIDYILCVDTKKKKRKSIVNPESIHNKPTKLRTRKFEQYRAHFLIWMLSARGWYNEILSRRKWRRRRLFILSDAIDTSDVRTKAVSEINQLVMQ